MKSAIRGKRGQDFLKELLSALDAMPEKRLIQYQLQDRAGDVCTLGVVGAARDLPDLGTMDSNEHEDMSKVFDIARALVKEIEWQNDEAAFYPETPEQRWTRIRRWVASEIKETAT